MHYFVNIYLRISQVMRRRTDVNKAILSYLTQILPKTTRVHLISYINLYKFHKILLQIALTSSTMDSIWNPAAKDTFYGTPLYHMTA